MKSTENTTNRYPMWRYPFTAFLVLYGDTVYATPVEKGLNWVKQQFQGNLGVTVATLVIMGLGIYLAVTKRGLAAFAAFLLGIAVFFGADPLISAYKGAVSTA